MNEGWAPILLTVETRGGHCARGRGLPNLTFTLKYQPFTGRASDGSLGTGGGQSPSQTVGQPERLLKLTGALLSSSRSTEAASDPHEASEEARALYLGSWGYSFALLHDRDRPPRCALPAASWTSCKKRQVPVAWPRLSPVRSAMPTRSRAQALLARASSRALSSTAPAAAASALKSRRLERTPKFRVLWGRLASAPGDPRALIAEAQFDAASPKAPPISRGALLSRPLRVHQQRLPEAEQSLCEQRSFARPSRGYLLAVRVLRLTHSQAVHAYKPATRSCKRA